MSNQQQEKVWGEGIFAKKKSFPNGGEVIEISLRASDAIPFLQNNVKQNGYVNLKVYGSRQPRMDDYGNEKLNVELDTWQPRSSNQNSQSDYTPQTQPSTPPAPQQPAPHTQHGQPVQDQNGNEIF